MLKLTSYPGVMLMAFLLMGHTKFPASNKVSSSAKPLPVISLTASPIKKASSSMFSKADEYYQLWDLARVGLSESAFNYALKGYDYLCGTNSLINKNIITIVDFSRPSNQKRLYILDIVNGKILYNTLVAHGRNSGSWYAKAFSNLPESHQSSLGFYITMGTYNGSNGYSLKLKGCEKGINDKALERAIVMHGADYVSNTFINNRGFLGRSYGCPSVPVEVSKEIIDLIKNGSCLFVFHPSKKYFTQSKIINSQDL